MKTDTRVRAQFVLPVACSAGRPSRRPVGFKQAVGKELLQRHSLRERAKRSFAARFTRNARLSALLEMTHCYRKGRRAKRR
jgi:hypothetical protein